MKIIRHGNLHNTIKETCLYCGCIFEFMEHEKEDRLVPRIKEDGLVYEYIQFIKCPECNGVMEV